MKKKIVYLISLLLFVCLVLASCIRADKPEKESTIQKQQSLEQLQNYEPYPVGTKTINGVDYLLSRSPAGKYGGTLITSTSPPTTP